MWKYKSAFLENTDDLTCRWCNELFTCPVTLGCGHSLCWACAARVRDRKEEPRCRYKECGIEIRDIPYVVNRTLDKMVQRAKILENTRKDKLFGVGGTSVDSPRVSWSIPPLSSAAISSCSNMWSLVSKYGIPFVPPTLEMRPDLPGVYRVVNSNTFLDELDGDGEVEGSCVPSSCSIASMRPPPYMSPARTSESGLFSSKTTEMSDAEERCESVDTQSDTSAHNSNGPSSGKGPTEARGSESLPSFWSDGDSGCKETLPVGSIGYWRSILSKYPIPSVPPKLEIRLDLPGVYSVGNSNTSKDELGADSAVEGRSVAPSCSFGSMKPPPHMSPARTSDVELFSSKTPETCDAGHSVFKETLYGGFTTGSCADATMDRPPAVSPPWPRGPRSVSSTTSSDVCSVGDSGTEEFETPAPGRTTTGNGCRSQSLSFSQNINREPFRQKPGSDQGVIPEQTASILHSKRRHSLPSVIPQGEPGLKFKDSDTPGVTKRGWKSKAREGAEKSLAYSKPSSGKRSTMDPVPEGSFLRGAGVWTVQVPT